MKQSSSDITVILSESSLVRAISEVVAAVVQYDGVLSMAEYAVVADVSVDLAAISDNNLFANAILTDCLLINMDLDSSLKHLSSYAKNLTEEQRNALRLLFSPLIKIQGEYADEIDGKLSRCLRLGGKTGAFFSHAASFTQIKLPVFGKNKKTSLSKGAVVKNAMLIYGKEELANIFSGDEGSFTASQVEALFKFQSDIKQMLAQLHDHTRVIDKQSDAVAQVVEISEALEMQIMQRLKFVEKRLFLSADHFSQDMEDFYEAVSTSFALDLKDLVYAVDYTSSDVWEVLNKGGAGRQIQSGYERIKKRMDENLRLWNDELEAFSGELNSLNHAVMRSLNRMEFESLIPARSLGFKIAGTADIAANTAVTASVLAVLSTSALVGLKLVAFGSVMSVLGTPAGLVALGVMGVSTGYTMFRNVRSRINKEIKEQQNKLVSALRKALGNPEEVYIKACEEIMAGFNESAERELQPIMLEAALAKHYGEQQQRLIVKLSAGTEQYIDTLMLQVGIDK
ncbi:hypothetical protein [Marinomonas sp.]|uniref:hypothetical protein n=1 Tax=Marinomonas sp. TaxID=1904862 RepID=UPI003BAC072B